MGGHVNTIWTDEQSEMLTDLLAGGKSFSEIAAALNEQFNTNYSRNAACGKGFRLGLAAPKRAKAIPKQRKRGHDIARTLIFNNISPHLPVSAARKLKNIEEIQLRCAEIEPRHLTLDQLEADDCRYPFGDNPFTFCGRRNMDGSSYCIEHFQLSTTQTRTNSDAVTAARANRMRRINFRKTLLEGAA